MGQIKVTKAPIEGLYIIEPTVHGDARGYFMETYNQKDMEEAGLNMVFVQDNQSMSKKGVLRGLHFQKQYPQGSEGFAHGFLVLSDTATFCYKCTDFYHPGDEGGLAWNDPAIGINWPDLVGEYQGNCTAEGYEMSDGTPLSLSDKDQKWLNLDETFHF